MTSRDIFRPTDDSWQQISPRYVAVSRWSALIGWALLAAISVTPVVIWAPRWAWMALAAFWLVVIPWRIWVAGRRARTWRYSLREHDLVVAHGLMWREMLVVPYGRMQAVEVSAGPILRAFGLASVEMKTAAALGSGTIPGVPADEAERLRDELARRGEEQAVAL